jgi:hypothetical protein
MEPSGRNRWQPAANERDSSPVLAWSVLATTAALTRARPRCDQRYSCVVASPATARPARRASRPSLGPSRTVGRARRSRPWLIVSSRRVDYGGMERSWSRAQAGLGIAPSASLIRVQTFMLTTTPTISRISSGLKFSASASWKRWKAASRSVSAARVSASA